MIELLLSEKIYGRNAIQKLELFGHEVMRHIQDLEIEVVDFEIFKGWVKVAISGEDEVVAANFIRKVYGEVKSLSEASREDVLKGFARDVGKVGYGLYLDAFVEDKDALIPLYSLRESLVANKKLPLRKIVRYFGIVENMPLEFVVHKIEDEKIEGTLSPAQVEDFMELMKRGLDVLVVTGASRNEIEGALKSSGHTFDVIRIERLSFLCHRLICKEDTMAQGLIPELGPFLSESVFGIFSPKRIIKGLKIGLD